MHTHVHTHTYVLVRTRSLTREFFWHHGELRERDEVDLRDISSQRGLHLTRHVTDLLHECCSGHEHKSTVTEANWNYCCSVR